MGTQNPVFFDSASNVHRPMDAGATIPVTATPISVQTGNNLQALPDGLYAGNRSGIVLYVDAANGNDANAGTKAAPFKTVDHAMQYLTSLFPSGYFSGRNCTVALHAGQTHAWTSDFNMISGSDLKITFYGDAQYGDFDSPAIGTGANPWVMSDLARPNIAPASSQGTSGLMRLAGINLSGGSISLMGITVTLPAKPSNPALSTYSGTCDFVRSTLGGLHSPVNDDGTVSLVGSIVNMSDYGACWGFLGCDSRTVVKLAQFASQFQVGGLLMNAANAPSAAQLQARQYFIKFLQDYAGNNQSVISLNTNSSNSSAGSGIIFCSWSEAQALVVTGSKTNLPTYPLSFDPGYGLINYIFNLSKTANGQPLNFLNSRLM